MLNGLKLTRIFIESDIWYVDVKMPQGVLEAVKAYRTEDGRILMFRPEENAERMRSGAERLCMPAPSVEQFLDAVKQTVTANKHWVPFSLQADFLRT